MISLKGLGVSSTFPAKNKQTVAIICVDIRFKSIDAYSIETKYISQGDTLA